MFKHIKNFPSAKELEVLIGLYHDTRDALESNKSPYLVYKAYLDQFPQYEPAITNQFKIDEAEGFPSEEEIAKELSKEQFEIIENTLIELDLIEEKRKYILESLIDNIERQNLLVSPGGKMVVDILDRFEYLSKHYISEQLGLKIPKKNW